MFKDLATTPLARGEREAQNAAQRELVVGLATAAQNGDEEAWSQLHHEFTPMLRKVAAQYRLGEADIVDVIQDTWIKCFQHLGHLRNHAALPGWLKTTCCREAICCLRARARCAPAGFEDQIAIISVVQVDTRAECDPLAAVLDAERCAMLRSLLDELGPRDSNLIRILIDNELSYREIADLTSMPVGSIGPTRQRILAKLRERLLLRDLAA